jgi:protein-L-isoaspartate(D-aspartate) O-methyltransferase
MTLEMRRQLLIETLRAQGIDDARVLGAMNRIPRELFTPEAFSDQAYEDTALPIGSGQTLSQPSVVGFMTQALHVDARMKVLEIGTGSGYQTAILARLCRRVYSIERYRSLLDQAQKIIKFLNIYNVTAKLADGSKGWPEQAPFDRILVTAAAPIWPPALMEQLSVGGIMIAPIGLHPSEQQLMRLTRGEKEYVQETFMPVRFVPLVSGRMPS